MKAEIIKMEVSPDALWVLLGGIGGGVKVFFQWTKKFPENFKEGITVLFLNVFISGFSGYMGALFASLASTEDRIHVIFAGIFGYLGVTGLDWIAERLKKN